VTEKKTLRIPIRFKEKIKHVGMQYVVFVKYIEGVEHQIGQPDGPAPRLDGRRFGRSVVLVQSQLGFRVSYGIC
jgi:hypothetical protein